MGLREHGGNMNLYQLYDCFVVVINNPNHQHHPSLNDYRVLTNLLEQLLRTYNGTPDEIAKFSDLLAKAQELKKTLPQESSTQMMSLEDIHSFADLNRLQQDLVSLAHIAVEVLQGAHDKHLGLREQPDDSPYLIKDTRFSHQQAPLRGTTSRINAGHCFGFTKYWVMCQLNRAGVSNFPTHFLPKQTDFARYQSMRLTRIIHQYQQNQYLRSHEIYDGSSHITTGIRTYSTRPLNPTQEAPRIERYVVDEPILSAIQYAPSGKPFMLALEGVSLREYRSKKPGASVGLAIAIHKQCHSHGAMESFYFDPRYGEFCIPEQDFSEWFKQIKHSHLHEAGYWEFHTATLCELTDMRHCAVVPDPTNKPSKNPNLRPRKQFLKSTATNFFLCPLCQQHYPQHLGRKFMHYYDIRAMDNSGTRNIYLKHHGLIKKYGRVCDQCYIP